MCNSFMSKILFFGVLGLSIAASTQQAEIQINISDSKTVLPRKGPVTDDSQKESSVDQPSQYQESLAQSVEGKVTEPLVTSMADEQMFSELEKQKNLFEILKTEYDEHFKEIREIYGLPLVLSNDNLCIDSSQCAVSIILMQINDVYIKINAKYTNEYNPKLVDSGTRKIYDDPTAVLSEIEVFKLASYATNNPEMAEKRDRIVDLMFSLTTNLIMMNRVCPVQISEDEGIDGLVATNEITCEDLALISKESAFVDDKNDDTRPFSETELSVEHEKIFQTAEVGEVEASKRFDATKEVDKREAIKSASCDRTEDIKLKESSNDTDIKPEVKVLFN